MPAPYELIIFRSGFKRDITFVYIQITLKWHLLVRRDVNKFPFGQFSYFLCLTIINTGHYLHLLPKRYLQSPGRQYTCSVIIDTS